MNKDEYSELTLTEKALKAMESAVAKVVEDHRRRGVPLAVWRDGKVVLEMPEPVDALREEQGAYSTGARTDTDEKQQQDPVEGGIHKQTMKPYYQNTNTTLHHGDALEILSALDEASVDLIFADPPYNLSNDGTTCHAGKRVSVNKGKWDSSRGIEADFTFHSAWIAACRRVLKPNGALWISGTYHSIYACGFALQQQGWHLLNDICWFKPNAAPNLACRMFTASHETLLWARKDKKAKHCFNYDAMKNGDWEGDFIKKPNKQMRSVWSIVTPKKVEKKYGKHPTQKPEALLERIILACSLENDVILDPFCGSGTTGVVALRHNRKFIGIDAERSYLDSIAIPRIEDVMAIQKK